MSVATFEEIDAFARRCFKEAKESAAKVHFPKADLLERHYSRDPEGSIKAASPQFIGEQSPYVNMPVAGGVGGWAVILSVDLRGSSKRADEIPHRDTFLTMHTYLPTMAKIVAESNGLSVGLRGDGLFAAFGFTEYDEGKSKMDADVVSTEVSNKAINDSADCGKAMIEAVQDIINPILVKDEIRGLLQIGVGISVGDVVLTNIGIDGVVEKTLYGRVVNQACKVCCGQNEIILTKGAREMYPKEKGGTAVFTPRRDFRDGSLVGYVLTGADTWQGLSRKRTAK